jgi:3-hydroxyacyl-[acyl-carrier-protein] dehydratase
MKLAGDFFLILDEQKSESGFVTRIFLNYEHVIYKGHFPGHPITPGVIQMQLVHELLERHLKKKVKLISMAQCKFLSILSPDKIVPLKIVADLKTKDDCIVVNASGMNDDNVFFKLSATYQVLN